MLAILKRWVLCRLPVITGLGLGSVRYRGFDARDDAYYQKFVKSQIDHPVKHQTLDWLHADETLPDTFSILDIGCGPGAMARLIETDKNLKERVRYTGLDQSDGALSYCKKKYPTHEFMKRDVLTDGLPEKPFDVIMLNEVIEHIPGYTDIIDQILARRPRIFILSTFAAIPERERDRRLWRPDTACYMNTYAFNKLHKYLRNAANGDLRIADFGPETYDRYWFPEKARILWYFRIVENVPELKPGDHSASNVCRGGAD